MSLCFNNDINLLVRLKFDPFPQLKSELYPLPLRIVAARPDGSTLFQRNFRQLVLPVTLCCQIVKALVKQRLLASFGSFVIVDPKIMEFL